MKGVGRLSSVLARSVGCPSTLRSSGSLLNRQIRFAAGAAPPGQGPSPQGASSRPAARGAPGLIGPGGLPIQSSKASGTDPAEGPVIELTSQNAGQVLQNPAPVLLQVGTPSPAVSKKLSRLRVAASGRLPLATLDCKALPSICKALQIQSDECIFLMSRGQVAAALEEDFSPQSVTAFVEKAAQMLGLTVDLAEGISEQLGEAEELEWQDVAAAEAIFEAVNTSADLPQASRARSAAGIARCQVWQGRAEEAAAAIEQLADDEVFGKSNEVKQAQALMQLHKCREGLSMTSPKDVLEALKAAAVADPKDVTAAEAYALALFWSGDEVGSIDVVLKVLRKKRSDEARKLVLMFLEALGVRHPRYAKARKSFSNALFA